MEKYIKGLVASLAIAGAAYMLNVFVLKGMGAPTLALLIGILLGNTILQSVDFEAGTAFAEKRLLEYSVMLLGLTMTFQAIAVLRFKGVVYILILMILTIKFIEMFGLRVGFSQKETALFASGNAVCGSSAIASVSSVIGATKSEKARAITLVNLMGTFLMLSLPPLVERLFPKNPLLEGAVIGGIVQSVGQVVASATMVDLETTKMATLFKIMRILLLFAVVLYFGKKEKTVVLDSDKGKRVSIPYFVLLFFLFCTLNSVLKFPPMVRECAHSLSTAFEIIALAAIGLRLSLKSFLQAGKKMLVFSLSTMLFQILLALLLLKILYTF
jgi:uncharacterized integral membrane protein (TIGR00698 family)